MSLYEKYILPTCLNLACGQREKVVPMAQGRVLEIGMGSGLNIPFYDASKVDMVWGLEPSEGMRRKAQTNLKKAPFDVPI